MPQIIPYYFIDQLTITFLALFVLIYILGTYFLPLYPLTFVSRLFITKL